MPIPIPRENEDKNAFIQRCMSDQVMVAEFPDEKQRYAVCLRQFESKSQKHKED